MFSVGQKVVCIEQYNSGYGTEIQPHLGLVYTIREVGPCDCCDETVVRLVEIHNKPMEYQEGFGEMSFYAHRFRPVVDISDLAAIVREQMLGKPRTIAPDKFDKQRVHPAAPTAVTARSSSDRCGMPPVSPYPWRPAALSHDQCPSLHREQT